MEYKAIKFEKKEDVAVVTLNEPEKMNCLSDDIMSELSDALDVIEADEDIKVMILTGSGRAFCAGGDLKKFSEGFDYKGAYEYVEGVLDVCAKLAGLNQPTIAAVNGFAVGAGLSVCLMCDLAVVADNAKVGSAYINMGLIPDLTCSYFLPRVVGLRRAQEMCMTARNLSAEEALDYGIANRVAPADSLMDEAMDLAKQITKKPSWAVRHTKKLLNTSVDMDFATYLKLENHMEAMCFISEDANEAIKAFVEKREPVFKGR